MMDGLQFNPISLIQSVGWTVCLQNSSVPVRERVIVLVALRRYKVAALDGLNKSSEPHHRKPTATGMNVVCTSL
jgi:hypothetical protein